MHSPFLFPALLAVLGLGALASCSLPEVKLATPEPIKVDINVDLNVYQHASPEKAAEADAEAKSAEEASKRKYNRQEEVQKLKNQRFVAETHRGTLLLREKPAGDYGDYVKKTVDEENADRMALMTAEAAKSKTGLNDIMRERYEANLAAAHPGEWVEEADPAKPESCKLVQKR